MNVRASEARNRIFRVRPPWREARATPASPLHPGSIERGWLCQAVVVVCLALSAAAPALAQDATPLPESAVGLSRADPVPLGETVVAGPVELRVVSVLIGPDAVAAVLGASATNEAPREGTTYVAVDIAARNVGDQPLWLDNDDFALTGD